MVPKKSWETIISSFADQQHHSENVFEGASLITIQRRYEGYLNLARRWTLEREKHNQYKKSEDEERDAPSSWTMKQMINMEFWTYMRMFNYSKKRLKMVKE